MKFVFQKVGSKLISEEICGISTTPKVLDSVHIQILASGLENKSQDKIPERIAERKDHQINELNTLSETNTSILSIQK